HFRIDHDLVWEFRLMCVKSSPDVYLIPYLYRFKITFPYFVPVFLKDEINLIAKTKHRTISLKVLIQLLLIKPISWNICLKPRLNLLKCIKTYPCQFVN